MLALGTKGMETASKVPLPNAEAFESLLADGYLPPIVSLRESTLRARTAWRVAKPPFIRVFKDMDSDKSGGEEIADDEAGTLD
jgi:hypothetical protein